MVRQRLGNSDKIWGLAVLASDYKEGISPQLSINRLGRKTQPCISSIFTFALQRSLLRYRYVKMKRDNQEQTDSACLAGHHWPFVNPDVLCHCVCFPYYLFFPLCPRLQAKEFKKKKRRRCSSSPVSTFHFPGLPHQQREYTWLRRKEEEQKQCQDRKCRIDHRGGEKESKGREEQSMAKLNLYGDGG